MAATGNATASHILEHINNPKGDATNALSTYRPIVTQPIVLKKKANQHLYRNQQKKNVGMIDLGSPDRIPDVDISCHVAKDSGHYAKNIEAKLTDICGIQEPLSKSIKHYYLHTIVKEKLCRIH